MTTRKTKGLSRAAAAGRVRVFDNAGHLDIDRAQRLLDLGKTNGVEQVAFVAGSAAEDDLAEELAEEAVHAMTTGADQLGDDLNQEVEEDWGGPFVVTSANKEFALGTDESNIEEATREPFPTT
ncbi:MAG TPA: hypothetical protein VGK73_09545 [Polyangiaceae bacterium]